MRIVGIDEVGRGCWAGPLVAGAVLLAHDIPGLRDSKLTSVAERQRLSVVIHEQAVAVGLGWVWPDMIDRVGLTASVALAMRQALTAVVCSYDRVIIDGSFNFLAEMPKTETLVKADATVPAVSAASIVAKVARDTYMTTVVAEEYPLYGFEKHVGYGTKLHRDMLAQHGVTPVHRCSYKPIKQILVQSNHA